MYHMEGNKERKCRRWTEVSYTIQSSEKLRSFGSENEAKALFYMMGERADSKEIYYFAVDVFNDLTGMTNQADKR